MYKTKGNQNKPEPLAVGIITLSEMLDVGRNTANKIGEDAGATIRIGRRKLYVVDRIKSYLNEVAENGGAIDE